MPYQYGTIHQRFYGRDAIKLLGSAVFSSPVAICHPSGRSKLTRDGICVCPTMYIKEVDVAKPVRRREKDKVCAHNGLTRLFASGKR